LDEFAQVESRDQGKPVKLAKNMDIPRWSFLHYGNEQAWFGTVVM